MLMLCPASILARLPMDRSRRLPLASAALVVLLQPTQQGANDTAKRELISVNNSKYQRRSLTVVPKTSEKMPPTA
jgi:hypothetical protein